MPSIRSSFPAVAALAATMFATMPVSAQAQTTPRTKFGALIGLASASISDADLGDLAETGVSAETKRRMGFQIGAYLTQPLSGNVSFQPEVHYIQKGAKLAVNVTDIEGIPATSAEAALKFAYLEVPLLLRLDLGEGRSVRPFLVAGPALAYRISCNLGLSVSGASFNTNCDESLDGETESDDPFKKFDASIMAGAGVAGTMGALPLSVQARFSYGLLNIANDAVDGRSPKNTVISLLFGIGF
jgi:hypothetical protein